MCYPTAIHPQAILAIDSVNNRVIFEYRRDQSLRRVEYYRGPEQSFVEVIDLLLRLSHLKEARGIAVGVYPGPGKFTKVRTGVLVAHWVAREYCDSAQVFQIPLRSMEKPLLERWGRFRTQRTPCVVYGKPPSISKKH